MKTARILLYALAASAAALALGTATAQDAPLQLGGMTCSSPPAFHCPTADCPTERILYPGPAVELKTRRTYFLDYPCDLKKGEDVTLILSLHGGGSFGNWQRHYFPLLDQVDRYRLVIATPNSPIQVWSEADDAYLQNIVESAIAEIGAENVRAFWLVGHSQGGFTSNRLLRTAFFKGKVDGWLSLSGGRLGGNPGRATNFGRPGGVSRAMRPTRPPVDVAAARAAMSTLPEADFSFIFAVGQREMDEKGLIESSEWAARQKCGARKGPREIADTKPGYVYDPTSQNPPSPAWGQLPAPGKAQIYEYSKCADGRIVADVVRLEKGHTEGLEPAITEELVKLIVAAPGGKLQRGSAAKP
jgi:poly(3-hydroxybutyrate) depolymerase